MNRPPRSAVISIGLGGGPKNPEATAPHWDWARRWVAEHPAPPLWDHDAWEEWRFLVHDEVPETWDEVGVLA